jgi:hypothetical protein
MRVARPSAPGLNLQQLLTIDVAAELRKLCQAQLQGPWQLPAELVRRAVRAGANNISVTLSHQQLVVADDGPGIDPALLQWTAILVDRARASEERHRALATLEQVGELSLLALASLERMRDLDVRTVFGKHRHALSYQSATPAVVAVAHAGQARGTQVTVRGPGIDRRRAIRWLTDVTRFAPVSLLVNGKPLPAAHNHLVETALTPPLRGQVSLVAEGDTAHAYLLAHGVVTAHVTVPEAPCFEAAVELGGVRGELTPARLRDAVAPHIPALVDQAVALLARAAQSTTWSETQRARLARLTLQAARRNLRRPDMERLPVFRTYDSRGPSLIDLATVWRSAVADASGAPTLLALSPDQRPDRYVVGNEPVLVADDAERSLLAETLAVRFRTPNRRESAGSPAALVRRLLRQLRDVARQGIDLIRHPRRQPLLDDLVLSAGEQAFLVALRESLRDQPVRGARQVVLCQGAGPLRRPSGTPPVLALPRANPTVMACVRAFTADPRWLRLIQLALVKGIEPRA